VQYAELLTNSTPAVITEGVVFRDSAGPQILPPIAVKLVAMLPHIAAAFPIDFIAQFSVFERVSSLVLRGAVTLSRACTTIEVAAAEHAIAIIGFVGTFTKSDDIITSLLIFEQIIQYIDNTINIKISIQGFERSLVKKSDHSLHGATIDGINRP
jgi:hypothetical protein